MLERNPPIYPILYAVGGHPIVTPNSDSAGDTPSGTGAPVRIYTYSGPSTAATISGDYQDLNTGGGDGQSVKIYQNGTAILPTTAVSGTLTTYSLPITLNPGDQIAWEIEPNTGYYYDDTRLTGVINSVPEPTSFALLSLTSLTLLARRRRH